MTYTIAIHPNNHRSPRGWTSRSDAWVETIRDAGHNVRMVDVRRPSILDDVKGCQGLMWIHSIEPDDCAVAKRLLPVLEQYGGLCVFPDQKSCWHYDDKVAQFYLFDAVDIPTPKTWVFWRVKEAMEFCDHARYPLVAKLSVGASAVNVKILRHARQARRLLQRLFSMGVYHFERPSRRSVRNYLGRVRRAALGRHLGWLFTQDPYWQRQKNYVYFQEFLPNNTFDTRVTVIGNRAFGRRRFNRPSDFRASGSGDENFDPDSIDERFVRLAFLVTQRLGAQICSIDGLFDGDRPVVGEISYTCAGWAVHACPGHWRIEGDAQNGRLVWQDGQMWPEQAQAQDLLAQIDARQNDTARFNQSGDEESRAPSESSPS